MDLFNSASFKKHVEDLMLEWHVPGLSIAAFDANKVTPQAYGLASVEQKTPVTPETIFDCASISKSLTAAAVGKLVEDDNCHPEILWSTPMSRLLPGEFVLPTALATEVTTIEDILCHRCGTPRHDWSYLGVRARKPDTPQSITRNLRNLPMTAEPRTTFQYCNMMYTVASYLIEKVSGVSFTQFLQSNILDVLGMTSTFVQRSEVFAAGQGRRLARPYVWRKELARYDELEVVDQPEGQGAGLVQSTVLDYAKWVQAVMMKDNRLMSSKTYDELIKPRIIAYWGDDDESLEPFTSYNLYALGWENEFYRGLRVVMHDGNDLGYSSRILFLPELEFGLAIFGNSEGAHKVAHILGMELIDSALNIDVANRIDWPERSRQVMKEDDDSSDLDDLRRRLCPAESASARNLTRSLELYLGTYNNAGYQDITIDIKNSALHMDGSDRGMPFEIRFEHVCDDTKFVAEISDDEGVTMPVEAEFRFEGAVHAVAVGIAFCEEMHRDLIWFQKVSNGVI